METFFSSRTQTVVISPDRPFVVIGERINPSGRRRLAAEMAAGDFSRVRADAIAQVEAGAQALDVNAGVPNGNEPELMRRAVQVVMEAVEVPLCIDSANPQALEAGLAIYPGKALINSTTGEDASLDSILPLAQRYGAAVVALCSDERGPVQDPQVRAQIARKIIERAAAHGIHIHDLVFDPLVMSVGMDSNAAQVTLETMRLLRGELGVNLTSGASNVSFGLPDRAPLSAAFLSMAMVTGLDCAITNPLEPVVRQAVLAGDLLLGHDEYSARWIRDFRRREKAKRQAMP